jgi:hypothetical protein
MWILLIKSIDILRALLYWKTKQKSGDCTFEKYEFNSLFYIFCLLLKVLTFMTNTPA